MPIALAHSYPAFLLQKPELHPYFTQLVSLAGNMPSCAKQAENYNSASLICSAAALSPASPSITKKHQPIQNQIKSKHIPHKRNMERNHNKNDVIAYFSEIILRS